MSLYTTPTCPAPTPRAEQSEARGFRPWLTLVGVLLLPTPAPAQERPIILDQHGSWVGTLAFSPDGRQLAIGTGEGVVYLWDTVKQDKAANLSSHTDAVAALTFLNDDVLVSASHDKNAFVHLLKRSPDSVVSLRGHAGPVLELAVDPSGKRLFSGSIDSSVREWNAANHIETSRLAGHTSWVNGLAIDPAGKCLASASSDNTLQVRRLKDLQVVHTFRVKEGEIRSVALSPDAKLVVAGIRYGHVRVWDLESGKEVASMKAHAGETWAVAFTPDGKTLFSGGGDWNQPGEVRLWNVGDWKERSSLPHSGEVLSLAISPDARYLAAGSWDRTVRIWKMP